MSGLVSVDGKSSVAARIWWLDNLRIAAIVAVVALHACAWPEVNGSLPAHIANAIRSLFTVCVPLFVMVSGALTIGPSATLDSRLAWRARGLLVLLVFWGLVYIGYAHCVHKAYNIKGVVASFVLSITPGSFHLWFLYLIIGLYLVTPAISFLYPQYSPRAWLAFCLGMAACFFQVGIGPTEAAREFSLVHLDSPLPWLTVWVPFVPYYIMGRLVFDAGIPKTNAALGWLLAITSAAACWCVVSEARGYTSLPIFFLSTSLFALGKCLWTSPAFGAAATTAVSKSVFGIYLIHNLFRNMFRDAGGMEVIADSADGRPVVAALLNFGVVAAILLASFLVTRAMQQQAFCRRLVS